MAYQYVTDILVDQAVPADICNLFFQWKEHLVDQGWTVLRSSDGTTYNASGDQITTAANLNNNRAWFEIQSPGAEVTFIVQAETTSSRRSWRVKVTAAAAGFSGGSPAATVTGSATSEHLLVGTGSDASPGFTSLFVSSGVIRAFIKADDAAPYGFLMGGWSSGVGLASLHFSLDPMVTDSFPAGDEFPYSLFLGGPSSGTSYFSESVFINASPGLHKPITRFNTGAAWLHAPACTFRDGSGTLTNAVGTHEVTVTDTPLPFAYARRVALGTLGSFKGFSSLFRLTLGTRATSDTMTVVTARDYIVLGDMITPWNGSIPTL